MYTGPLSEAKVLQHLVDTLPRNDGSASPLPIALLEVLPPVENRVTDAVPQGLKTVLVNVSPHRLSKQNASLFVTREIRFARATWELIQVIEGTSTQSPPTTKTYPVTVGLTVEYGKEEASKIVQERSSFVGVDLKYGESNHVFTKEETQEPHPVNILFAVPPPETVYMYQRKYMFGYNLWFTVKASVPGATVGDEFTIGPDSDNLKHVDPVLVTIATDIRAEEILLTGEELLEATIQVRVEGVPGTPGPSDARIDVSTINGIIKSIVGHD